MARFIRSFALGALVASIGVVCLEMGPALRLHVEALASSPSERLQRAIEALPSEAGAEWRATPEAEFWLERSAAAGSAEGMRRWGLQLVHGSLNIEPDPRTGTRWLERAAEAGDAVACFELGELAFHGLEAPMSIREAHHWYEQGAALGDWRSMLRLEEICEQGLIGEIRPDQAMYWRRQAIEHAGPNGVGSFRKW